MKDIMVDKLLDDNEVRRLAGESDTKVIAYPELQHYHDVNHLFGRDKKVIILYLNSNDGGNYVGHWTLLMKTKRGGKTHVEFNDSYANEIDEYLDDFPQHLRDELDQSRGHLSSLLYDYCHAHPNAKVEYNEIPFQRLKNGVNTCGRWVGVRAHFSEVPLEQWQGAFKKLKKEGYDLDKIITIVSNHLLKKRR